MFLIALYKMVSGKVFLIYHIVAKIPNIQHEIFRDVNDLHAIVINQLYHGSTHVPAHVRVIMHSLMLVHYCIVHVHKPWYN